MGGDWVWLGNQLLPQYLFADAPPGLLCLNISLEMAYFEPLRLW